MSGKVIQGFFIGGGIRSALAMRAAPVLQRKAGPRMPGPPPPAFGGTGAGVQARSAAGVGFPAQPHGGAGDRFEIDPVRLGLARGGGQPLPRAILAKMEAAFSADFSNVRVHVGPQAARIGAVAFAMGNELYFAPGQYQPETTHGQRLIGHELAHVIQQRQGRVRAPGSGVAVVQDRVLEAEADRLGDRAANYRAAPAPRAGAATWRPGTPPLQAKRAPWAPPRTGHPAPPSQQRAFGPAHVVQRSFDYSLYDDITQDDLDGNQVKNGTSTFYNGLSEAKLHNYVFAEGKVYSYIKVNGAIVSGGENQKAASHLTFHDIGYNNQKGLKDNFHSEDWSIESFRRSFEASKKSMDTWLNSQGPSSANTGVGGKHVISIRINFSSCQGCVTTIQQFKKYLEGHLGSGKFILRVKFLRPYDLAVTAKDPNGVKAQEFLDSIQRLRNEGINVRMQPFASADAMTDEVIDSDTKSKFAVYHKGVAAVLPSHIYNELTKTWTGQGVNRKGTGSSAPVSSVSYVCGAPTKTGGTCTRTVKVPGSHCYQHV